MLKLLWRTQENILILISFLSFSWNFSSAFSTTQISKCADEVHIILNQKNFSSFFFTQFFFEEHLKGLHREIIKDIDDNNTQLLLKSLPLTVFLHSFSHFPCSKFNNWHRNHGQFFFLSQLHYLRNKKKLHYKAWLFLEKRKN